MGEKTIIDKLTIEAELSFFKLHPSLYISAIRTEYAQDLQCLKKALVEYLPDTWKVYISKTAYCLYALFIEVH